MKDARWLLAAMLGSVALVAIAMFYDEQKEFEDGFTALREEQIELATAVSADFESRLDYMGRLDGSPRTEMGPAFVSRLLGGAKELEQPRSRLVLVSAPHERAFFSAAGERLLSPALQRAVDRELSVVTLSREAAAGLGLPPRLAVAGIRRIRDQSGTWNVVIVASAERLRERERRSQLRFLLGVMLATSLVGAFGGLALRDQRRNLAVARELEVTALQRERERLLAKTDKMTSLAALSSGIAHQVATPLGTILARIDQVLPSVANEPKAAAALSIVADQVGRIQQVIRGVLALVRGQHPSFVEARPEQIVSSALSSIDHRLEQAGLEVVCQLDPQLPTLSCDPTMLEQALLNLLLNACDASLRGDAIHVRVESTAETLRFVVEDAGAGMSEETAARAGEPFFTTKPRGTGLGLALASEVASHHRGHLSLELRAEGGTRAVFELPFA